MSILNDKEISGLFSRSGKDNVVDRDEYEFDEVADGAHNEEAHDTGLQNLHVLCIVWFLAFLIEHDRVCNELLHLSCNVLLFFFHLLACHLLDTTIIYILFMILYSPLTVYYPLMGFWGFGVLGF